MGLRFRKSINLGGVRLNLSKSGVGYSVGVKGARITKTANGRTRTTLSVPSTGISYVKESSKSKPTETQSNEPIKINHRARCILYGVCAVIFFLCGLICLIESVGAGIAVIIVSVLVWISSRSHSKKAKQQSIDK